MISQNDGIFWQILRSLIYKMKWTFSKLRKINDFDFQSFKISDQKIRIQLFCFALFCLRSSLISFRVF
jgi:hypothetical protein